MYNVYTGRRVASPGSKHLSNSGATQLKYHVSEVRGANRVSHGVGSSPRPRKLSGFGHFYVSKKPSDTRLVFKKKSKIFDHVYMHMNMSAYLCDWAGLARIVILLCRGSPHLFHSEVCYFPSIAGTNLFTWVECFDD